MLRIESIDGSAVAAEDYIAIDQVVDFDVGEMEKQVSTTPHSFIHSFIHFNAND